MNKYKTSAMRSIGLYTVVTLLVLVACWVWMQGRDQQADALGALVYVPVVASAVVGAVAVVFAWVTVLQRQPRRARTGQLLTAAPHLFPAALYGYFGIAGVRVDGLAQADDGVLTAALLIGAIVHLAWFVYSVTLMRGPLDESAAPLASA